ncbi:MAG: trypsin-like peptidase domain-containing protein, partial [Alphaproteobacteria bacterium]
MASKIAPPSSMSMYLEFSFEATKLANGTGFVAYDHARQPMLVTARHNLTGKNQESGQALSSHGGVPDAVTIWHCPPTFPGLWISRREELLDGNGDGRWIEHPKLGAIADMAALPLENLQGTVYGMYKLKSEGPRISTGPGEPVSVVGYPFGLRVGGSLAVWATGFIASDIGVDYEGQPKLLIDCRARQGQSGSPVIVYRHGGSFAEETNGMGSSIAMAGAPVWRFLGVYSG